jgi:hypothetical protein
MCLYFEIQFDNEQHAESRSVVTLFVLALACVHALYGSGSLTSQAGSRRAILAYIVLLFFQSPTSRGRTQLPSLASRSFAVSSPLSKRNGEISFVQEKEGV